MNRLLFGSLLARLKALFGSASATAMMAAALVCGLSCVLMAFQILNFSSRDQVDREVLSWLPLWSVLERAEYALLDRRFTERGMRRPRSLDSIAIVGIDEASLRAFNQWPWPRQKHARLVDRLKKAGARVIGLDIGFDDYANPVIDAKTGEVKLSPDDQLLARAIERAGNVVLVSRIDPQNTLNDTLTGEASRLATPIDEFDVLTPDISIAYVKRDSDGGVRRYPLRISKPPETAPLGGFAPLCVALFQGLARGEDLGRYQAALNAGIWPDTQKKAHAMALELGVFPGGPDLEGRTRVWTTPLNFWGPPGTFPTYSYRDVVEGWSDAKVKQHFEGRIVLVGATAHVLKDNFPAPDFTGINSSDVNSSEIPGVEVHATMAAMLLDGTYLRTQSTKSTLWTLLILTVFASAWTTLLVRWTSFVARRAQAWWASRHLPGRVHSALWIGLCALLGPVPIWAFWWGANWMFSHQNLWVIAIYPALGAAMASGATLLLLFGAESSDRRKILTQMSRLVAPDVMDEILAHPEEDYPRPRRVHATVLFTDLEGFTSYSESREPEEVVTALNNYFRLMQPIVHAYGGSVDKYIGDSVMAFFGAPVPRADHAAQALRCAIEMQDECARFRRETGVPFWMRVGVHTGDLIVGGVGSDEQNNYTAIGDTVNLASRLEATNKSFGSRIICSSATHLEAPNVALVERSQTPIRGKSGDVEILIVRGPFGEPPRDETWGHGDTRIDWSVPLEIDRRIEPDRRLKADRRRPNDRRGNSSERSSKASSPTAGSAKDRRGDSSMRGKSEKLIERPSDAETSTETSTETPIRK